MAGVSEVAGREIESSTGPARGSHETRSLTPEIFGRGPRMTVLLAMTVTPIKLYQWFISPLIPSACRYWPTCSDYMAEAIKTHGVVRGVWLGSKRLCRCHPYGGHGIDLVPINKKG